MKKILSGLLALILVLQNVPVGAFAAEEEKHVHTAECGYVAAVPEVKCDCAVKDDTGALMHTEGCGYVAAVPGKDCTFAVKKTPETKVAVPANAEAAEPDEKIQMRIMDSVAGGVRLANDEARNLNSIMLIDDTDSASYYSIIPDVYYPNYENGSVEITGEGVTVEGTTIRAKRNSLVTVKCNPDNAFIPIIETRGESGDPVEITWKEHYTYTFTMPSENMILTVEFISCINHVFGEKEACPTCGMPAAAKILNGDDQGYYFATLSDALNYGGNVHALANYAGDFTIPDYVKFHGGAFEFAGNVTNQGEIKSGTFTGKVTNEEPYGFIEGGIFKGEVTNRNIITGGNFEYKIINYGEIINDDSVVLGTVGIVNEGGSVSCVTHSMASNATCTKQARCAVCGEYYGDLLPHTPASDTDYTSNGDGTHRLTCTICGDATAPCSGGTQTCQGYQCEFCKAWYGEKDLNAHSPEEGTVYNSNGNGTHSFACTLCDDATMPCSGGTQTCMGFQCVFCEAWYGKGNPNAHSVNPDTGACSYCGNSIAVAKAGDQFFDTVDEALSYANGNPGAVLVLLEDVDRASPLSFDSCNVTLDLNGYHITAESGPAITLQSGTLIIADSEDTGSICSNNSHSVQVNSWGNLQITGGIIGSQSSAAIQAREGSSNVTVSGGTIYGLALGSDGVMKLTLGDNGMGATFPGGLGIRGTIYDNILAEGASAWVTKDGKNIMYTKLSSFAYDSTPFTVRATCTHQDAAMLRYEMVEGEEKHRVSCENCNKNLGTEDCTLDSTTGACDCGRKRPAVVKQAPVPNAKTIDYSDKEPYEGLMYNYNEQELVKPGTAENGTMVYSLNQANWSAAIPTAMNAGTYTVYYKAQGDATHADSEIGSIEVSIAKARFVHTTADLEYCVNYDPTKSIGFYNWPVDVRYDDVTFYPELTNRVLTTNAPKGETGNFTIFVTAEFDSDNLDISFQDAKLIITDHIMRTDNGRCTYCETDIALAKVTSGNTDTYCKTLEDAISTAAEKPYSTLTLIKNVTLNADKTLVIPYGTFTMDLNGCELKGANDRILRIDGGTITITDSQGNGAIRGDEDILYVGLSATLNITGGNICATSTSGFAVHNEGKLNISGGTLNGCVLGSNGEVKVSGSAKIETTQNIALRITEGKVTITGGSISGNQQDLTVAEGAEVMLSLAEGATVGATFPGGLSVFGTTVNAILADGVSYWAENTMLTGIADNATSITGQGTITVKATCTHQDADKLRYEKTQGEEKHQIFCEICNNFWKEEGCNTTPATCQAPKTCTKCKATFGDKDPNAHIEIFSVEGSVITVSCEYDCGDLGTATVSAESKTYSGEPVVAELKKEGVLKDKTVTLTYAAKDGGALLQAPVNAGTYIASISIPDPSNNNNSVTACVEFTIRKALSAVATAPAALENLTFKNESQVLVAKGAASGGTMHYSLDNAAWSADLPTGKDAGSYTVYYKVVGDENHEDSEAKSLAVTIAPRTISDANVGSFEALTYNGQAQTPVAVVTVDGITITGTWSAVTNVDDKTTFTANGNFVGKLENVSTAMAKAAPTVTEPTAKTLTYTGKDQPLVNAGSTIGGTLQYSLDGENWAATIPTGKNAGEYTVFYKVIGDANYKDVAAQPLKVTIAKATAPGVAPLVQSHFSTYVTANNVDLTKYLPADRSSTTYAVESVAGDIFSVAPAISAAGTLTYTTRKLNQLPDKDTEIKIKVVMENYVDVELKVTVKLSDITAETRHQIVKSTLTEVPAGLTGTAYNTVDKIKEAQKRVLVQSLGSKTMAGIAHYDVNLQFSPDGGRTWVDATEENFPANGLTVTLPYPTGTGKNTHDFNVSHMFTAGNRAGTTETPAVTKTAGGIQFTVTGLSPVSVAWNAVEFNVKIADVSNGTVTTDISKAVAGAAVNITVKPKSGYRLSTLTVKDATGTSYAVGAENNGKYGFTMPAADVTVTATFTSNAKADPTNPKTGDDFQIIFWSGMMITTMLGAAVLLLYRKKFYQR